MKISYALTVVDEHVEIQRLVNFLLQHKRAEDEIVILYDSSRYCQAVEEYLRTHSVNNDFHWHSGKFEGHFADWKNILTTLCTGDWIFQIDADELPHDKFIRALPEILQGNPEVDVVKVPRVNTVAGLTPEHVTRWGWHTNEQGWVNWPDYQMRIWKRKPEIQWKNRVHEVLTGYATIAELPAYESLALLHPKTIERQEKQNQLYSTL
jgi:hypothetical protein